METHLNGPERIDLAAAEILAVGGLSRRPIGFSLEPFESRLRDEGSGRPGRLRAGGAVGPLIFFYRAIQRY